MPVEQEGRRARGPGELPEERGRATTVVGVERDELDADVAPERADGVDHLCRDLPADRRDAQVTVEELEAIVTMGHTSGGSIAPMTRTLRVLRGSAGTRARREIDAAIECIGCGMCLSACTIVAHNPRFPGPAALNRAFTLELDPRDDGQAARWRVLLSDDALARCHGQGNCTEVCPMDLRPMRSIVRLRQRAALRLLRLRPRRP